ncbi:6-hydroxytryprostatin B O-methyltransferase 3 [Colletotrichum chlorophyti]|uniref:6-hydroxytryprostatin B O-methyltransferase 3 n=1 Tax=Colletotrichum chlorophyti TaxID=708187 RepID=A0A1Q8RJD8_9PEZI|nr:6-hydroxytryprostatin B O-methyltransferase 3 [Colletotrichum chlorophyti]
MPSATQECELFQLVSTLTSASVELNEYLSKHGLQDLSTESEAPRIDLAPENSLYFRSRSTIIDTAEQIIRLVRGPRDALFTLSHEHLSASSMQLVMKYKLAHIIPLDQPMTSTEIAKKVAKPEVTPALVERILLHTSSFGLFEAQPGGVVSHNAMSAQLVTDPDLAAWVELLVTITYPAGAAIPEALEKYGYSMEGDEAAYGVSIGRKISQFQRFREPDGEELHGLFARAMRGLAADGACDMRLTVDGGYPWHLLEQNGTRLVVDVGGGPGHFAMSLAKKCPKLMFEVQDLPETVKVAAQSCPEALKGRISFRPHDFLTPQPKHEIAGDGGIAYFCRFILHDWSDKYAQVILQNIAASMRPQDRIIINDVVVPEPGHDEEKREKARRLHDRDILMLMNLNGRERTRSAFESLCNAVTPKLRVQSVFKPEFAEVSLIEITLASN